MKNIHLKIITKCIDTNYLLNICVIKTLVTRIICCNKFLYELLLNETMNVLLTNIVLINYINIGAFVI